MGPVILLLLLIIGCIGGAIYCLVANRRYVNVGVVVLLATWTLLFWALPKAVDAHAEDMHEVVIALRSPLDNYIVRGVSLLVIAALVLYGYRPARSTTQQFDIWGLHDTSPDDQPLWATLCVMIGVILGIIGFVMLLFPEGGLLDKGGKIVSWFKRPTIRVLAEKLIQLDAHTKKKEFNASVNPYFFDHPKRLISPKSMDAWKKAAEDRANEEGVFKVEDIDKIEFHSPNGTTLSYATVFFQGKKEVEDKTGKKVFVPFLEGSVTLQRNVFPEDEEKVLELLVQIDRELPRSPSAVSGKASLPASSSNKVSVSLPVPPGVKGKTK